MSRISTYKLKGKVIKASDGTIGIEVLEDTKTPVGASESLGSLEVQAIASKAAEISNHNQKQLAMAKALASEAPQEGQEVFLTFKYLE